MNGKLLFKWTYFGIYVTVIANIAECCSYRKQIELIQLAQTGTENIYSGLEEGFELYNSLNERRPRCRLRFVYTFIFVGCSGFSQGRAESVLVLQNKEQPKYCDPEPAALIKLSIELRSLMPKPGQIR